MVTGLETAVEVRLAAKAVFIKFRLNIENLLTGISMTRYLMFYVQVLINISDAILFFQCTRVVEGL